MSQINEQIKNSFLVRLIGIESFVHAAEIIFLAFTYQDFYIGNINITILIILYLITTFTFGITKLLPSIKKIYFENIAQSKNYIRWVEYTISSTLLTIIIALLVGYVYELSLLFFGVLNVVMILLGYFIETAKDKLLKNIFFNISMLFFSIIWIFLGYKYFYYFADFSNPIISFVSKSLFWIEFVLYLSFGLNMFLYLKSFNRWKDYVFVEQNYILLSIFSKSSMFWILWIGILSV